MLDYLATKGMTPAAMDINVTAVKFNGDKADASVSFAVKGSGAAQMAIQYHLELKDSKWVVVGRQDANQHGGAQMPGGGAPQGAVAPGTDSPHGGMMAAPGAGGKMPAPEDLPPASKKK